MGDGAGSTRDAETNPLSQTDWRESWAGNSARPIVRPVGSPVVVLDQARMLAASGFAQDVGEHYPTPRASPSLAHAEEGAAMVESDGTSFGVFS